MLSHGIALYPNALAKDLCSEIIARFHSAPDRIQSHVFNGSNPDGDRTGSVCTMVDDASWRDLRDPVIASARKCVDDLGAKHDGIRIMVSDPYQFSIPRVEMINPGQGYPVWHMDARQHVGDRRFLTVLFYLNDVWEGGAIEFTYQRTAIQPRAGAVLLFPPFWTHLHRGQPPISNPKYTVGFFATLDESLKSKGKWEAPAQMDAESDQRRFTQPNP